MCAGDGKQITAFNLLGIESEDMKTKIHWATITILIKDRQTNVAALNKLLTEKGYLIRARLGVNIEPRCQAGCMGLITLVVEGTNKEISALTKEADSLYGIVAKSVIMTD